MLQVLAVLGVLVAWAGIVAWRRGRDEAAPGTFWRDADPRRDAARPAPAGDDGIDRATLERAEREVRDLQTDVRGRPLEDAVGDDWGPGTPKPPYV